ncbi:MAG TPA: (4Fe-4S)-binding protein [Clostridiales bacterium]|jgi:coenzyme F420-reducing hydrogenase beta subunit|nr:(4Fe-4S)-binding protein [Clostridiales bacterium]
MLKIDNKSNCCGCHACYNSCPQNAIIMEEDEKGFKYPKINENKCTNCGFCEKVCPILNKRKIANDPKAYACINKDENIRENSSSGGIFTLIAKEIINMGGVVFGTKFDSNFNVIHSYTSLEEELYKFRGSKYVQSIIGDNYKIAKSFLEEGKYVLFTGTPCQIEGLLAYLGKKYDKLFTQDIICHGVPSPKVWRKYLDYRKHKDEDRPLSINFRNKDNGWSSYNLKFTYENKSYKKSQVEDKYMQAFLRNVCLRDSCYKCSFKKINRLSDITLADFWGIQRVKPELYDNKGTSLVIVNSEKGKELFESIKENIIQEEVNIEEALVGNTAMLTSAVVDKNRVKFFENLDKLDFSVLVNKYTEKPSLMLKIIVLLKKIAKRILFNEK